MPARTEDFFQRHLSAPVRSLRPAELFSAPAPAAVAGCALVCLARCLQTELQKQAWVGRGRRRRRRREVSLGAAFPAGAMAPLLALLELTLRAVPKRRGAAPALLATAALALAKALLSSGLMELAWAEDSGSTQRHLLKTWSRGTNADASCCPAGIIRVTCIPQKPGSHLRAAIPSGSPPRPFPYMPLSKYEGREIPSRVDAGTGRKLFYRLPP